MRNVILGQGGKSGDIMTVSLSFAKWNEFSFFRLTNNGHVFLLYLMYLNMNYSAFSAGRNVQYQREDYNRDFKHVITMTVCIYYIGLLSLSLAPIPKSNPLSSKSGDS